MRDRVTRTEETIVLCHLGVPCLERIRWSLIDGMVDRSLTLTLEELLRSIWRPSKFAGHQHRPVPHHLGADRAHATHQRI